MLVVKGHVIINNVRKQMNKVTFFPNKLKSRETFANFISFSDFRHVLDLFKHRKSYFLMLIAFHPSY